MGKFKAAKKKSGEPVPPQVRPGAPCLVILLVAIVGTMFLLYEVMKNAS